MQRKILLTLPSPLPSILEKQHAAMQPLEEGYSHEQHGGKFRLGEEIKKAWMKMYESTKQFFSAPSNQEEKEREEKITDYKAAFMQLVKARENNLKKIICSCLTPASEEMKDDNDHQSVFEIAVKICEEYNPAVLGSYLQEILRTENSHQNHNTERTILHLLNSNIDLKDCTIPKLALGNHSTEILAALTKHDVKIANTDAYTKTLTPVCYSAFFCFAETATSYAVHRSLCSNDQNYVWSPLVGISVYSSREATAAFAEKFPEQVKPAAIALNTWFKLKDGTLKVTPPHDDPNALLPLLCYFGEASRASFYSCVTATISLGCCIDGMHPHDINRLDSTSLDEIAAGKVNLIAAAKEWQYDEDDRKHVMHFISAKLKKAETIENCFAIYQEMTTASYLNHPDKRSIRSLWRTSSPHTRAEVSSIEAIQAKIVELLADMKRTASSQKDLCSEYEKALSHTLFKRVGIPPHHKQALEKNRDGIKKYLEEHSLENQSLLPH